MFEAITAATAVGLIYGLGGILALLTFHNAPRPVTAGVPTSGTTRAVSGLTVDYSGLHRGTGRGRRGHRGDHRA
jgi:hypothetical protein